MEVEVSDGGVIKDTATGTIEAAKTGPEFGRPNYLASQDLLALEVPSTSGTYGLECSTDLFGWQAVQEVQGGPGVGVLLLNTEGGRQFYRFKAKVAE